MVLHRVTLLSAMLLCEFSACLTEIIYLQDCHSISPHGVWPTCTGVITELFKQDVFIYTSVLRLLCWKDKLNTRMQTSCKVILLKSSRHFMKTWLQLIFLYFVWPNKKLNNSTDKDVDDFHQNRKRLFVKYLLPFKGRKTKTRKFSELAL